MFFGMSIPGDQSNPYTRQPRQPYPGAQQPGQPGPPSPYSSQPGQGEAPRPGVPENPYAGYGQQSGPGGYGQGQPAGGKAASTGVPGLAPTGESPTGSGPTGPPPKPRSGIPGWVWGVGGVVLTSAVWAAAVISTGGFASEPEADLAGYHFHEDMCAALDRTALEKHYSSGNERESTSYNSQHEALDTSTCSLRFRNDEGRAYASTFVDFTTTWHKKTDPTAEFEARARVYEKRDPEGSTYTVEEVEGVGQEAYLVTNTSKRDDSLNSVHLTARDGWLETRVDWSDGGTTGQGSDPLTKDEVREMLVATTNDTMEKLRSKPEESSDGSDDSSGQDGSEDAEDSSDPGGDGTEDEEPPKRGEGDI